MNRTFEQFKKGMSERELIDSVCDYIENIEDEKDKFEVANYFKARLTSCLTTSKSPVYNVIPVPLEKIRANAYNPNSVAGPEMKLLYTSIKEDGYTMPIVCYYDKATDTYEIVDGYHRDLIMENNSDIRKRENGLVPVSVIDKPLEDRIASTIRHNRARGSHDIALMSNIIAELVESGMSDAWIAKNIGMDMDEILRLKQITGIAALFKDKEFSRAWIADNEVDE